MAQNSLGAGDWQSTRLSPPMSIFAQSLGSRGTELESRVSQYLVSYRMRVLWKGTKHTEGLGCGMVFLFPFFFITLTTEPRAGSSAFLSPNNFLSLLIVDMGGEEQGGDSDNTTNRSGLENSRKRGGVLVDDRVDACVGEYSERWCMDGRSSLFSWWWAATRDTSDHSLFNCFLYYIQIHCWNAVFLCSDVDLPTLLIM